jgi:hypothetical protein
MYTENYSFRKLMGLMLLSSLSVTAFLLHVLNIVTGSIPMQCVKEDHWCMTRSWDMFAAPLIFLIMMGVYKVFDVIHDQEKIFMKRNGNISRLIFIAWAAVYAGIVIVGAHGKMLGDGYKLGLVWSFYWGGIVSVIGVIAQLALGGCLWLIPSGKVSTTVMDRD